MGGIGILGGVLRGMLRKKRNNKKDIRRNNKRDIKKSEIAKIRDAALTKKIIYIRIQKPV